MDKMLLILEVSGKQGYIFGSRKLRDNVQRSADIRRVTESAFFREAAGPLYDEKRNMVNSGGGHTILEFDSRESARAFAARVTEEAMRRYPEMELFAAISPYNDAETPGENFRRLFERLEEKKARRVSSFRQVDLGFDTEPLGGAEKDAPMPEPRVNGRLCAGDFGELAHEGDPFIAVIHIDGNGMGKKVEAVYDRNAGSFAACRSALQRFSAGIDEDFRAAFEETVSALARQRGVAEREDTPLPIRGIIQAGDDVCFATSGKFGLDCARVFLESLSRRRIPESGEPYSACAGVAIVHRKYPFHRAYRLAEELCDSAKSFGREIDADRRISAMDWHIEFGQLRENLAQLRQEYAIEGGTEDQSGAERAGGERPGASRMELRPVTVVVPEAVERPPHRREEMRVRSYDFFRGMCRALDTERGRIARGKLKELRTVLKQGASETRHFMNDRQINDLLYHVFTSKYQGGEMREQLRMMVERKDAGTERNTAFTSCNGTARSLFFDAIEMMDHCVFFGEVE